MSLQRIESIPPLPARPASGHKGTFGRVLIFAGSPGMAGAAALSGQGALHSGAGLVTLGVPRAIQTLVASFHPAYMTVGLPEANDDDYLEAVDQLMSGKSAVAVGPGLGPSPSGLVQQLYGQLRLPLVIDADALNILAEHREILDTRMSDTCRVLTPHPGEFARLTGLSMGEIAADRERLTCEFAQKWNLVILLKGQGTVIASPNQWAVNPTGCTALATGGSGDVLTGIITALIAQGMPGFQAAQLGAYVHGLAGEIAEAKYGARFVTALEILQSLGPAWQRLESESP